MTTSDPQSDVAAGVIRFKSPYSFDDTVQRLLMALKDHGIKVFATIDQRAEAQSVGLSMPPTALIIFGNPKAGTPLMLANPQSAIDLPLKAVVHELKAGSVEVLINSADYLMQRHSLPSELKANLAPVERLIGSVLSSP